MLRITNTLNGKKEPFVPLSDNQVKLYVCGITPYDFPHIGHGRVYVIFDTLYRLLKFLGYNTTYVRNFTDIDDKLMARAEKELGSPLRYKEIADNYIAAFKEDMARLNCLTPTQEPCVTETIPEIIAFIEGLIKKGVAYHVDGDVYYHIPSYPDYGKFAKQNLDELRAGARVDIDTRKKDPLDFALWKSEKEGTYFKSPWGWGRPGWHIECSAMAKKFLGDQIDIHGGGMDLIFPHHQNEIAQTEGLTNKQFARYWMHNAFVRINKEKMSKSLGNFFTLRDVITQFDPMLVRYLILTHHYRSPLDFSFEDFEMLKTSYKKLCNFFAGHTCAPQKPAEMMELPIIKEMVEFITDDLNTPGLFGVIFSAMPELSKDPKALCAVKQFLQEILGLTLEPLAEKTVEITPEIQELLDAREKARAEKNWTKADQIRDQLIALGVELKDRKA